MSDLISRSKVISVLEQLEEHSLTGKMDISNAIYLLNNQPTAYSVDKVVEELKNASWEETDISTVIYIDDAIEIVKQCGVDEHKTLKCEGCRFEHIKEDDAFNCDCVHCSRAYSDCYEKVVE